MTDQAAAQEATTTTQAHADTQPAPVDPTSELEALKAKYERAQKDLTKFRTRAEEVEAAQKAANDKALAEADATKRAELLQAKVTELEAASAAATAKALKAERRATLTGRVNDLDLAEAIAAKYTSEDGTLDVDALLKAHPSLAATRPPQAATTGASTGMPKGTLTPEDFRGKPPEWVRANLDKLQGRTNQ